MKIRPANKCLTVMTSASTNITTKNEPIASILSKSDMTQRYNAPYMSQQTENQAYKKEESDEV